MMVKVSLFLIAATATTVVDARIVGGGRRELRIVSRRHLDEPLVGYGGSPSDDNLPLGLCEGDCDDDRQVGNRTGFHSRFL